MQVNSETDSEEGYECSNSKECIKLVHHTEHGFALHKDVFRDALCLRYIWLSSTTPTYHLTAYAVHKSEITVEHALNCPCGSFPYICHNKICDITSDLMNEVCHGIGTEPELQPVTEEQLSYRSVNRSDGARLDIATGNFWGRQLMAACIFQCTDFQSFCTKLLKHSLNQLLSPQ